MGVGCANTLSSTRLFDGAYPTLLPLITEASLSLVRTYLMFYLVDLAAKPAEEKSYTGAIVGGIIGGVVFLFIVVGIIWWCSQKKKVHTGRVSPENPQESLA